jgi:hypothetical protein
MTQLLISDARGNIKSVLYAICRQVAFVLEEDKSKNVLACMKMEH